jgi:FkbM family methyltransferase
VRRPTWFATLKTGLLLLWLWTKYVGFWQSLRACVWVFARKALPGQRQLANALMPKRRVVEISVPGYRYPFHARWPGSDLHIVYTILTCSEYAPIAQCLEADREITFLDIGANIGAASTYFLERFPRSRVVAVEPAPDNAEICRTNLKPYGARAMVIEAAIWNADTWLIFEMDTLQTGTEAGVQVREAAPGEPLSNGVRGIGISAVLAAANVALDEHAVLALKIDIEGSEEELFSGNTEWLSHISCIAIELHDIMRGRENCTRNFTHAVQKYLAAPPWSVNDTTFAKLTRPG